MTAILHHFFLNICLHFFACTADITEDTVCVGLARVGAVDQTIATGTLQKMTTVELGGPLHSIIITGTLHPLERDMLKLFAIDDCF